MYFGLVVAGAMSVTACFAPESKQCGTDGPTCPAGWACTADNQHCINLEVTRCGDGNLDSGDGGVADNEQCDDGNLENHDGCNFDCTLPTCGDGLVDNDEVCDDGNTANGDGCAAGCNSTEVCGDFVVNDGAVGEECDEGGVDTATCNADCTEADCGDGKVNSANGEECDGGTLGGTIGTETASCNADCTESVCGDAKLNTEAGEQCDLGLFCANGDSCSGDDEGTCADGSLCINRDHPCCSSDCQNSRCGNGIVEAACGDDPDDVSEVCDDGQHCYDLSSCTTDSDCAGACPAGAPGDCDTNCRTRNRTGCSADCRSEERCGDGYVNDYPHSVVSLRTTCFPPGPDCPFPANLVVGAEFQGVEACDDGNTVDGDGCSADCLSDEELNTCGDGYLNDYPPLDELCDDGNNNADDGCAADCGSTEDCGNEVVDPGEECDDGALNGTSLSVSGCSVSCTFVECNNGRKDPGEACDEAILDDDGVLITPNLDTSRCTADCLCNVCGDEKVNNSGESSMDCPGPQTRFEECDDGGVDTATCNRDCTGALCGDGIVNFAAGEVCDNGPGTVTGETAESADCNIDCTQRFCGDGKLNVSGGEICDDGNNTPGDGCGASCLSREVCGDGIVNPYQVTLFDGTTRPREVCDDGSFCDDGTTACTDATDCAGIGDESCAPRDGTGCSADCQSNEICGDAYLNFNETCDDGNTVATDGCDANCILTPGWSCPTLGGPCDEVCGDGLVVGLEGCDDDGLVNGDGCTDNCRIEPGWDCPTAAGVGGACTPICGDLLVRLGETCDDGNVLPLDGCDDTCTIEVGWSCPDTVDAFGGPCVANCGDGDIFANEECDDNNLNDGDGCDSSCRIEDGWDCTSGTCVTVCGDGFVRGLEACDDGNLMINDGCDDQCEREPGFECPDGTVLVGGAGGICDSTCGDGLVRSLEACDDANTVAGDGCDSGCKVESGWSCEVIALSNDPSLCTPDCGDSLIRGVETCDDGNTDPNDGCDASCAAETGWICPTAFATGGACVEDCGDGMMVGAEACDDANANSDNADCTSTCAVATCTDGLVHSTGSGSETDVDCGGSDCPSCANGQACLVNSDCMSNFCNPVGNVCQAVTPPVASDDMAFGIVTVGTVVIDVGGSSGLTDNDTDFDAASFEADTTSSCGATVATDAGLTTVTYTLPADPSQCATPYVDTFDYTVCSEFDDGICDTATVTVTINQLPILDDAFTCTPTGETRASLSVGMLYSDPDPDPDNISLVTATGGGGLATVDVTVATWAPNDRDLGQVYTVVIGACDDAAVTGCASATWTAVWNDPPTLVSFEGPTALTVLDGSTTQIPFGDIISTLGIEGVPAGGVALESVATVSPIATLGTCTIDTINEQIEYVAGAATGPDVCTVEVCEVCDGGNVCSTATLEFAIVNRVNAIDDSVIVIEGNPASGVLPIADLVSNDTTADIATYGLDSGATACGGTVTSDGTNVSYTAPADPSGCTTPYEDTFTYTVCTPGLPNECDDATVTIRINRHPELADSLSCVAVGTANDMLDLASGFTDPDGDMIDAMSIETVSTSDGAASTVGTVVTWTPTNPATAGSYVIALEACDDATTEAACDTASWTAIWNDAPTLNTFTQPNEIELLAGTMATLNFSDIIASFGTTSVAAGSELASFTIDTPATTGTCAVDLGSEIVTYMAAGTAGTDSCVVEVCEVCAMQPVCSTTQLDFNIVNGVVANSDAFVVVDGNPTNNSFPISTLLSNDSNFDTESFALTGATTGCGASISIVSTNVRYTEPSNPSSCSYMDSFTYEICNDVVPTDCTTATVSVRINRPPAVADEAVCLPTGTASASVDVTSLFSDPESDGLDSASIDPSSNDAGTASVAGTVVTWTPTNTALEETYVINIEACDDLTSNALCDTGTWTVAYNAPATLGSFTGANARTVALSTSTQVTAADLIIASDTLDTVLVSDASGGTYAATATTASGGCSVDGSNNVTYTAGASTGTDSCFIEVCEVCNGGDVCATTELSITIVECVASTDCSGGTPVCDTATNTCKECVASSDCSGATPVCDTGNDICVACLGNSDCSGATPICDVANDACVACLANSDCSGATPLCDVASDACVECLGDSDCSSGVCNLSTNACSAASCSDNVMNGDETATDCGGSCPTGCATGEACAIGGDCDSGVCDGVTMQCSAPTCTDSTTNGDETDVDCGGSCPNACGTGDTCGAAADCMSGVCDGVTMQCSAATCTDSTTNGDETDVDCGGSCPNACGTGDTCAVAGDCVSGVCDGVTMQCSAASCTDSTTNGDETDVDCGGSCPNACGTGDTCAVAADCVSGVCDGVTMQCNAATCTDGTMNGDETDVDCGGSCPNGCGTGEACGAASDCDSGNCDVGGTDTCVAATCSDGIMNGDETGIDCGGTSCLSCDGDTCALGTDCASGVCDPALLTCSVATCTDTTANGDETDVDCGGSCPDTCADGLACAAASDCESGVCDVGGTDTCTAPTCSDGVMNGDETGVDCGGTSCGGCDGDTCTMNTECVSGVCDTGGTMTCSAATCTDTTQNGDETDVDCGGSCPDGCDTGEGCTADADCMSGSCDTGAGTCNP